MDVAQTAVLTGGVDPGEVGVLAVDGRGEQLGVEGGELGRAVAERNDLSWTDEREVCAVREGRRREEWR